jgi:hypothetical protein
MHWGCAADTDGVGAASAAAPPATAKRRPILALFSLLGVCDPCRETVNAVTAGADDPGRAGNPETAADACGTLSRMTEQSTGRRKLVVFVPPEALDAVRDAVFAAGAGRIGDYERCSWHAEGTGTFRALPGANPTVGEVGEEERVAELRLETVFPVERHEEVVAALRAAHPYEEPAFDVYVLL